MGGSQSTVSVTEEFLPTQPPLETHPTLKGFSLLVEGGSGSFVGSGQRMYKTFKVKYQQSKLQLGNNNSNNNNNTAEAATSSTTAVVAVLKVAYLQKYNGESQTLTPLLQELEQLQKITASLKHAWPTATAWFGPSSFKGITSIHPTVWIRPHIYTTLGERLINRPWLDAASEKLLLVHQLLTAVHELQAAGLVHGNLTTQNIGYTSHGFLVLLDVCPPSFRPRTFPTNDPTEYFYTFGKRACYLAPERLVDATSTNAATLELTPAMDIFSVGCCLVELALNGEVCFDSLGQLLDYRATADSATSESADISPHLSQKLQKMESSALRAACRHMLSLDPSARLTAAEYLERLQEQIMPADILQHLYDLSCQIQVEVTPDARCLLLFRAFSQVLYQTRGIRLVEKAEENTPKESPSDRASPSDLWEETEMLLKELDAITNESSSKLLVNPDSKKDVKTSTSSKLQYPTEPRTPQEEACLLIYVQQVLSTIRHVQRPITKRTALRLVRALSIHVSDETRLQRMVPAMLSLVKDTDALVRTETIHVLSCILNQLQSFPPSDAQMMPQYVFKRVAPLITDSSLSVRVALAENMGVFAETAQRFLDISQAVRLVQAVEGGGLSTSAAASGTHTPTLFPGGKGNSSSLPLGDGGIFEEKVTQLLDSKTEDTSDSEPQASQSTTKMEKIASPAGAILVHSSYQTEHSAIAETLSRWVVHVCTDQSENASLVKRALLTKSLEGLCSFFSLEGVMAFILPQLLAFLNDRQDWQLRSSLFAGLPVVCRIIGRGGTEEFVLPCIETGLVDNEEQVIAQALSCLSRLIDQGLLSRALLLPQDESSFNNETKESILDRYSALLIHPSKAIRMSTIQTFCATCRALGSPDGAVYVAPLVRHFNRFQPSWRHLSDEVSMKKSLIGPWTREKFNQELKLAAVTKSSHWTTVGTMANRISRASGDNKSVESSQLVDSASQKMLSYIRLLAKHSLQSDLGATKRRSPDRIEGSLKLAQSVVFPRRSTKPLPEWYRVLREKAGKEDSEITEASSISSVSVLGSVYGLSIMGPTEGSSDNIIGAAEVPDDVKHDESDFLGSEESKQMELAFMGTWDSEVSIDPERVDTLLLATKLRALRVPTLPPNTGGQVVPSGGVGVVPQNKARPQKEAAEWKPRMNSMIASSSAVGGHMAPVMRLAVSLDSTFFVSASHDGTCAVWEIPQIDQCSGHLENSTVYTEHKAQGPARVNDVAMIEQSHSVVSGGSDGSVHVWRVDQVRSSPKKGSPLPTHDRSRVVGTSSVRQVDSLEGEILAVSHFSSLSNSVVVYATQKGFVRTWDLRSPDEPFALAHGPKLGHLSSMALGGDRSWIVTGTSRGFVALWDIRFQQPFKLWRHARGDKINRLAASYLPPPQSWGATNTVGNARPYIFMGSPSNECSMFDVLAGNCVECFRTISNDLASLESDEEIPSLLDVSGRSQLCNGALNVRDEGFGVARRNFSPSVNCMVGSIGGVSNNFLLTGGSDGALRFWDFATPSRCYTVSGASSNQPRPTYERIDYDGSKRLMLCRQTSSLQPQTRNGNSGLKKPEYFHSEGIEDLKIVNLSDGNALISCSRDCTIKVWR